MVDAIHAASEALRTQTSGLKLPKDQSAKVEAFVQEVRALEDVLASEKPQPEALTSSFKKVSDGATRFEFLATQYAAQEVTEGRFDGALEQVYSMIARTRKGLHDLH